MNFIKDKVGSDVFGIINEYAKVMVLFRKGDNYPATTIHDDDLLLYLAKIGSKSLKFKKEKSSKYEFSNSLSEDYSIIYSSLFSHQPTRIYDFRNKCYLFIDPLKGENVEWHPDIVNYYVNYSPKDKYSSYEYYFTSDPLILSYIRDKNGLLKRVNLLRNNSTYK